MLVTGLNRVLGRIPLPAVVLTVEACLIGTLAYVAASLFWVWVTPAPPYASMTPNFAGSAAHAGRTSYSAASGFDPFHRQVATPSETAVREVETAPETQLNLKLTGVRVGADAASSSAIIRTPDQKQAPVKVGGDILDGIKLAAVFSDRVLIVRRNGTRESLYLTEAAKAKGTAAAAPARAPRSRAAVADAKPATARAPTAAAPVSNDVPAQNVGKATQFLEFVTLKPRRKDNRTVGLYIEPKEKGWAFFEKLGLEPGDVVLSINRVKLTGFARLEQVRERLASAKTLDFVIERDGVEKTLSLDLEALRG